MKPDIEELVFAEQIRSLFKQTSTLVVSHPIAGILISWIYWDVVSTDIILKWLSFHLFLSVIRIPIYFSYFRHSDRNKHMHFWRWYFCVMAVIQGLTYSLALIAFVPESQPLYLVISAICMMGVSSCAIVGYSAERRSLFCFFILVMLPGIIYSFFSNADIGIAIGLLLMFYCVVILRTAWPVNVATVNAIRLNFKLEQEIESRKAVEEKLRQLSIMDGLTGLSNRRHFDEALKKEIRRAKRTKNILSLILIDIDYFKAFNDLYGHVKGDECLKKVAQIISQSTKRSGDLACRYGGEEFAVILPNTSIDESIEFAEILRKNVQMADISHDASQSESPNVVTVSVGVTSVSPENDITADEIVHQADKALYKAKEQSRNSVAS